MFYRGLLSVKGEECDQLWQLKRTRLAALIGRRSVRNLKRQFGATIQNASASIAISVSLPAIAAIEYACARGNMCSQ